MIGNIGVVCGTLIILRLSWAICQDVGTFIILAAFETSVFFMLFAFWLLAWIYRYDEGPAGMRSVANAIKEGAEGYVAVQYGTIRNIAIGFAVALWILYFKKEAGIGQAGSTAVATITAATFMAGAGCSGLSGYGGMWISVRTNG